MPKYLINSIVKEGSIIKMVIQSHSIPVTFDCKDKILTSYTGRKLKRYPVTIEPSDTLSHGEKWAISVLKEYIQSRNEYTAYADNQLRILELFISCLDLIEDTDDIPGDCPKGYIKWLRDTNQKISSDTLTDFKFFERIKGFDHTTIKIAKALKDRNSTGGRITKWYLELTEEQRKIINQIFKTEINNYNFTIYDQLYNFWSFFAYENSAKPIYGDDWYSHLDTNRGFEHNCTIAQKQLETQKNEIILRNEKKIMEIEKLTVDGLIVVVPKTMDDFTREGEMQNNCVGYYYHNSIVRGENLIYFIRKVETPDKSYVTCRYNVSNGRTVESRGFDNRDYYNHSVDLLISQVDKKICKLLTEEENTEEKAE